MTKSRYLWKRCYEKKRTVLLLVWHLFNGNGRLLLPLQGSIWLTGTLKTQRKCNESLSKWKKSKHGAGVTCRIFSVYSPVFHVQSKASLLCWRTVVFASLVILFRFHDIHITCHFHWWNFTEYRCRSVFHWKSIRLPGCTTVSDIYTTALMECKFRLFAKTQLTKEETFELLFHFCPQFNKERVFRTRTPNFLILRQIHNQMKGSLFRTGSFQRSSTHRGE